MSLEIQRGKSKWWYARVQVNGRYLSRRLGIEIKGVVPPTLKMLGDIEFERSRERAQMALDQFKIDLKKRTTAEELIRTVYEIRMGEKIGSVAMTEMFEAWKALPRRRSPSERYLAEAKSRVNRFVEFLRRRHPVVRQMADVQTGMAADFLEAERERGLAPKTYNGMLIFLRSCFRSLRREAGLAHNPFDGLPTRDDESVFRKPFTEEDLAAIIAAAREDPFIYPIIVTGICTALRKGDCCRLHWDSVDLDNRFVTVKTSKTGASVSIPMFPMFHDVLANIGGERTGYVFPAQAAMYNENPDGITHRTRLVLRKAGFFDEEDGTDGTASRGEIRQHRSNGLRRASVRDFHSLRVTWVTLALGAGVPIELVQKVTGHSTIQIVMKHYFHPGREEFRRLLLSRLPKAIVGGDADKQLTLNELRSILEAMTAETWHSVRENILARLGPRSLAGAARPD